MNRSLLFLPVFGALVLLAGCPMPQDATFTFTNTMEADASIPDNYQITSIQFRAPTDSGFGPNMLSTDETINPGESTAFFLDTQGNPGTWMIKIQYNVYVLVAMTSFPAYLEINEVTEGQEYTWNWSIF